MTRQSFIKQLSLLAAGSLLPGVSFGHPEPILKTSSFAKKLKPVGRALELEGYYVWCNCPIEDEQGKTHLFFSRWDAKKGMGGWIHGSEIAHAVADNPEAPFTVTGTVLAPRDGFFDATTCHNPLIKKIGAKYYLYYMGNSNGKTDTKRIGLATSDSLLGPWTRTDEPILLPGAIGTWDDHCTTNPAVIVKQDGTIDLFYKSWNTAEYESAPRGTPIRGNRKYGLATAREPEGPFTKYAGNPVIDFSKKGNNAQFEDAFVWREGKKIKMIARDMGVYSHDVGLIMESTDGIHWSEPEIAFKPLKDYIQEPPPPAYLKRFGRLERPMLLLRNEKPAFLFGATQGGKYNTSSSFIFKIDCCPPHL